MKYFIKGCNKIKILLRVLLILLLISPTIFSQWTQTNGPEGGNITKFLFNGSELFAFSRYDLFVSSNGGVSWNWRSTFPIEFNNAFLDGSDLFLLGAYGLYFSSDNGMTWMIKNNGLDTLFGAYSMIRFGNLLFLGGQVQPIYGDAFGALYISSDNGESWQSCSVPFVEYDWAINSFLAVDTILIALGQKAIYRSIDKGLIWQMVLNSAPYLFSSEPIFSIDSILILGSEYSVFRSSDYGANWQVVVDTTGASSFIQYNGTILASTDKINEGLLQSSDLGKSWYSLPFYSDSVISIEQLYLSNSFLFGMDRFNGLFRSKDGGINWENISKEFPAHYYLKSLVLIDSLMLVSNYYSEILRSTDYGTTWQEANNGLISMPIYYLYAEDNLLLVSNAYPNPPVWGMLFRSTDNGNTWRNTSSEIQNFKECFLRFKDKIYAGTTQGGVVSSMDDGASWVINGIPGGFVHSLVEVKDSIFAGISSINYQSDIGIYITADQGDNWSPASNGLPNPISVTKIIVVPESLQYGKIIFLATNKGVYHSSDNGNNWLPSNNGIGNDNIWTMAATYASTNSGLNLFAASKNYFFISNDLGESWISSTTGPKYESSLRLYSYPEYPGLDSVLFAIINYKKIFMSSDQGQNWESIGDGLEGAHIYDIDINSNYLYAGTSRGVWKRPLSEIMLISSADSKPTHYTLMQNYPNPFNPTTTIRYSIPLQSLVTIKIFDILGRELETLINEEKQAGTYEITWNATNRPSGIYFYKIKAGNYTEAKKMVLLK